MSKSSYKLVLIEWQDAVGVSTNWKFLDNYNKNPTPAIMKSVGWLLTDTKDCKVLVPNLSFDGCKEQGCGDMIIPTASILKIKEIK